MNILITGASLANKGAESMLYITIDEIRKHFVDANIYFATDKNYDKSKYLFKRFYMSSRGLDIAIGGPRAVKSFIKGVCYDGIKYCLGRSTDFWQLFTVKKRFREMDLIIDVSGFNLGKQWTADTHRIYLNRLELAKHFGIPVFLMPQSFGPFNYAPEMENIKKRMSDLLQYPKLIFVREEEGYYELLNTFHLRNIILSSDLVLQNTDFDWQNVFAEVPEIDVPRIVEDKIVGIVPNKQCFIHGDKTRNLEIYSEIIKMLLDDGYQIVVFRHSTEDIEIVNMIKNIFNCNNRVQVETRDFSCLEYAEYVKQFQFIICSRYHGIVHAYRSGIPVIILGWAIKYKALAHSVNQLQYAFDITEKCSVNDIVSAVKDMEEKFMDNTEIIKKCVERIQKDNCFEQVLIGLENE